MKFDCQEISVSNEELGCTLTLSEISATARKLAVIIWNMIVKKVPYIPQTEYQFLDQKRKKIAAMKKLIAKFDISTNDLDLQL